MVWFKIGKHLLTSARKAQQVVLCSLVLIGYGLPAQAELPAGISVSMKALKAKYLAADSLMLNISYTNVSATPIRFLPRNTALEGEINENFLVVYYDGQRLPYIGRHAKRLPPTEDEFITIAPGSSVAATVDVGFAYPMYEKGGYQVSYDAGELAGGALTKSSNAVTLQLSEDRPVTLLKRPPSIDSSCNATQRAQINQALGIAEQISRVARDSLNNAPVQLRPTARRYVEWFGQYSPARYATAQTAFNRISSALASQVIGFDCTCNINNRQNVFAFVFANDPFNMNVCPVFFRVAPSGTDSRAGTIIHEISHFDVVIGSDDFQSALDQRGSRLLARSNPSAAIRNANAFEYFAENTPFLLMPTINDLPQPPDLTVSSVSATDQAAFVDELVGVSATIANIGEAASSATVASVRVSNDAQISFTDSEVESLAIPALAEGSSFAFQSEIRAPSDASQIWLGVCVSAVSDELRTSNNCSTAIPLSVERRPVIAPIILLLDDETTN